MVRARMVRARSIKKNADAQPATVPPEQKRHKVEKMETDSEENKKLETDKKVLLNDFHSMNQDELNRHVMIHKIHQNTTSNDIRGLLKARDIQFVKLYVKQREDGSQYAFITLRGTQFAHEACEKFNFNAPTVDGIQLKLSVAKTRTVNKKGRHIQFGSVEFKIDDAAFEIVDKVAVGAYDEKLGFTVLPELTKWKADPNIELWDWAYSAPFTQNYGVDIVKFDKKRPEKDENYLLHDLTDGGENVSRVECIKSTGKQVVFRDLDSGYETNIENYRGDPYPTKKWAKYEYWYQDDVVPTGEKVKLYGVTKSFVTPKDVLSKEMKAIENDILKMKCYGVDKEGCLHVDFQLRNGTLFAEELVKKGLLEKCSTGPLEPCGDKLDGVYREEKFAIFNQAGFSPGDIISGRIVHIDANDIKSIYIQTDEPKILKRLTDELQVNITYGKEFLDGFENLDEGDVCLFIAKRANGQPRAMRGEIQERAENHFVVEAIDLGFSMNVKHKNCYVLPKEFKVVERQSHNVKLTGFQIDEDSKEVKDVLDALKSEKTLLDFQFLTDKEVFCPLLQDKMIANGVKTSFLPINK